MIDDASWPTPERALDIHARLCQGDPVASAELAAAFLVPLAALVERKNPRIDPHLCGEAAEDAILSLIKNPSSYNPERAPLEAYLRMSAQGDLRNLLQRERRHASRRVGIEAVELFDGGQIHIGHHPTSEEFLVDTRVVEELVLATTTRGALCQQE